ncbi:hypothetical protein Pelo_18138 [Pelomyxa schiedti]|nr:hypothetical protein Pelo_18138 [Pelomyxa schiedti]
MLLFLKQVTTHKLFSFHHIDILPPNTPHGALWSPQSATPSQVIPHRGETPIVTHFDHDESLHHNLTANTLSVRNAATKSHTTDNNTGPPCVPRILTAGCATVIASDIERDTDTDAPSISVIN